MCKITGQGFGESKTKATPYFYLEIQPEWEVINGEPTELPDGLIAYQRRIERYITDKTFDYLIEDLKDLGWPGGPLSDLGPEGSVSFAGQDVRCRCIHEEAIDGSGKLYERWMLNRGDGAGTAKPIEQPLDKTGLRKLDALFGDKLKSAFCGKAKAAPKPAASKAVARMQQPIDDIDKPDADYDLPF